MNGSGNGPSRKVSYQQMQLQKRQQQQQQAHRPSQSNRLSRGSSSAMLIPSSGPALPSLSTIMSQSPTRMRGLSSPDLPLNVAHIAHVNNTNYSQMQSDHARAREGLETNSSLRESNIMHEDADDSMPATEALAPSSLLVESERTERMSSPRSPLQQSLAMSPRDITLEESYPDRAAIHQEHSSSTDILTDTDSGASDASTCERREMSEDLSQSSASSPREKNKRESLVGLDDATEGAVNAIDFIIEHSSSEAHEALGGSGQAPSSSESKGQSGATLLDARPTLASVLRDVEHFNYADLPSNIRQVRLSLVLI
jgi:hypothetical protein